MDGPLPELRLRPGLLDTVRYAAAMWEFQRIHFDHDWAREEGLDGAIVQGPLLGNYLARTLQEALPAGYEIARLAWRNVAVVRVDEDLCCGGQWSPQAEPDGTRAAELWIRDGSGATVVRGTASIRPASIRPASIQPAGAGRPGEGPAGAGPPRPSSGEAG